MDIQTISSEEQVRELFGEWRDLQSRVGRSFFTDPAFFLAWWDTHGRGGKRTLHVTTGRNQGRLVALAPLVVVRRYGFRFLEWGGGNIFDYSDTLLDNHGDHEAFWHAIRSSQRYDVAFIKGIRGDFSCCNVLARFGYPARRTTAYRIDMGWVSGDAWMAEALSRSRRQILRRKQRHIERKGMLGFRIHRSGPVPSTVLNALVQQKTAWNLQQSGSSLFNDPPRAASLLQRMADIAAQLGCLHLSWLDCDEAILAVHLGFMHRNVLHYYMPSYDENWAQYSPGNLLLAHLIRWCIDNKVSSLDFMRGDDPYKCAYANARTELTDFLFSRCLKGRLADLAIRKLYLAGKEGGPVRRSGRLAESSIRGAPDAGMLERCSKEHEVAGGDHVGC